MVHVIPPNVIRHTLHSTAATTSYVNLLIYLMSGYAHRVAEVCADPSGNIGCCADMERGGRPISARLGGATLTRRGQPGAAGGQPDEVC